MQQLRYLHEVARCGFSVSEAADALFTSQPGVSKQIRQLEDELGVQIFVRHGKRLVGLTEPGRQVLAIAERMLRDVDNLKRSVTNSATSPKGACRSPPRIPRRAMPCQESSATFCSAILACVCRCIRAIRARSPKWCWMERPTSRLPPS
jgi:DNA-binding transcriptional LysR family regulator